MKLAAPLYAALWRWHFYAGLVVAPFLTILALTGIAMTLRAPIETVTQRDLLFVAPQAAPMTAGAGWAAVEAACPGAAIAYYVPPRAAGGTAEFALAPGETCAGAAGDSVTVFVNPYTAEIVGALDRATTFYALAKKLHGTLLMGAFGDHLIEVAASLAIVLVISGLLLHLNDQPRRAGRSASRARWRKVHGWLGVALLPALLFFLVSGLAWAPVWGGKLTQAWSSFPAERFAAPTQTVADQSHAGHHADLNRSGDLMIPWGLEQTPMPTGSGHAHAHHHEGVDLDGAVIRARAEGFTGFRIFAPRGADGAWTIAAATMSGDIVDPREDRTLHLDPATGKALADIGFAEYSPMAKAMAAGVSLHQAQLGPVNAVINALLCFGVIAMVATGALMWLRRRPTRGFRFAAPPAAPQIVRRVGLALAALTLFFPLGVAALLFIALVDFAATRRAPPRSKVIQKAR